MSSRPTPEVSRYLAYAVGVSSFSFLAIWIFFPQWKEFSALTMKANTAPAIFLASVSVALLCAAEISKCPKASRVAQALAFVVLLLGALTATEYLTGLSFGIDELLVRDFPNAESSLFPGRMSPLAALSFILLGISIICKARPSLRKWAVYFNISLMSLSLFSIVGYLFGASSFYTFGPYIRIAWQTAACLFALSLSLFLLRRDHGLGAIFFSGLSGGTMARRVLPAAILAPILFGSLIVRALDNGLATHLGVAVLVVAIIAVLSGLVFFNAYHLNAIDLKRSEGAARVSKSEQKFKRIFESNMFGYFIWNETGAISDANDELLRMLRYTREDLMQGKINWRQMTPPELAPLDEKAMNEIVATGRCTPYEKEYFRKDGSRLPVIVGGSTLLDVSGIGGIGFVVDNTAVKAAAEDRLKYMEQRRASESLQRSLSFLDAVIENIPNMIFIKDAENLQFVRMNKAGEELLGRSRDQLIGKSDFDFFPKEQAEFFQAKDREVLSSESILDIPEEEIASASKGKRLLHTKKLRLLDPDGKPKFLMGISEDITARKEAEKELVDAREKAVQATAAKTAFLANMSHEIRTPINGIIGMTKLLAQSGLNEDQARLTASVSKSSELLLTLVNDILDLTKVEAGKLELESLTFDLTEVMRDTSDFFEPQFKARGFFYETSLSLGDEPFFIGDPGRIRQILNNLIGNALKFTERGGLKVKVSRTQGTGLLAELKFEVTDTGIGVRKEVVERLFASFSQGDPSTSRKYGGTGLGLAISKRLVELMDGEIGVSSDEGQGSTFHFSIRVAPVTAAKATECKRLAQLGTNGTLTPAERAKAHILVAEDNLINQEITLHMLTTAGYRADAVMNGAEALASLKTARYDLVLMDCQMPEMDGYETAAALRAAKNPVPIIALTANAFKEEKDKCLSAGMSDYVAKPVPYEALVALVDKWVQKKAPLNKL